MSTYEEAREALDAMGRVHSAWCEVLDEAPDHCNCRAQLAVVALIRILELHAPDEHGECAGCRCEHGFPDSLSWPCPTARLILDAVSGPR